MNEQQANALFQQSVSLLQQGQHQEALKILSKLDQAIPSNPGILFFTATGHSIAGNKRKAIQIYERVLRLNPQFIEAYNNIALDLAYLGEHQQAIDFIDRALAIRPDFIEAIVNKGCFLNAKGDYRLACATFNKALRIKPNETMALANLSVALRHLGNYDQARAYAEALLKINPSDYKGHSALGKISLKLEDYESALSHFLNALRDNPTDADTLADLGATYSDLGNIDLAQQHFERALNINPDHGATHLGLGSMHHDLRNFEQALVHFNAPIQDKYRLISREHNRGITNLHAGNLTSGWVDYKWRWKEANIPVPYLETNNSLWDGLVTDKPVLLWNEQGIGDQILFGTLLPLAAERAPNLLARLDRRLLPLFQRSLPQIRFVAHDEPISDTSFTYHLPFGDLGQLFSTTFDDFVDQPTAYLKADPQRVKTLHGLLDTGKPIVGLAWVTKGQRSKDRNLPIEEVVSALQSIQPSNFVDLQYSDTSEDRTRIFENQGVEIRHLDEIDNFNDLDGLAALIMACDFVVTCSNSTAHLAGALGKETYLLVPFGRGRHWYWSHIREEYSSMWYPSIQVLPQHVAGDWSGSIQKLANLLNQRKASN